MKKNYGMVRLIILIFLKFVYGSFLGKYYNYDSSVSFHHDSIMSDQLAGFWYLRLCGHKYEVTID